MQVTIISGKKLHPQAALWTCALGALLAMLRIEAGTNPSFVLSLSDGTPVTMSFSAEPELAGCRAISLHPDRQSWRCSDYLLYLSVQREPSADRITFVLRSLDGYAFQLHEYGCRVAVPLESGNALWTFNREAQRDIMETGLERPWVYFSAANRGIPYLALVDRSGGNRVSLGLLEQDHIVLLRGEPGADRKNYVLTLRQTDDAMAGLFRDTIYISRDGSSWFHNARNYTRAVDSHLGFQPPSIPDAALNSTYDSWYWSLDHIDQELTWDLAKQSRSLGFKSYLIDAGWDTSDGEYVKGLKGKTGDYWPPPEKFPDFAGLIQDIQTQLGMKVMLWMQQYAMGRLSRYYGPLGYSLCSVGDPEGGNLAETPMLCPRTHAVQDHMKDLFDRILGSYRPDALWFDWQEEIPQACEASHSHQDDYFGQGYNRTQQIIHETVRRYSPDIFIDMRWPFANLNNKPYTHLWQPIDSAGDWEAMRLRAMVMRPFSAGLVMGTDEMYWDPKLPDAEVARFMAAVVFTGVPYFGPNLPAETSAHREMLRAWVAFYESNREDLVYGDFSPYGDRDRPDQLIEGQKATYIYYGNRFAGVVRLARAPRVVHVVNNSDSPGIQLTVHGLKEGKYSASVSDLTLQHRNRPVPVRLTEQAVLRFDVPVGCLLTLTPIG